MIALQQKIVKVLLPALGYALAATVEKQLVMVVETEAAKVV